MRVETRDVIAVFTNQGARLKSWRLKHYLDQQRQPQELIEHLPSQPLPFTLRGGNDATTRGAEQRSVHRAAARRRRRRFVAGRSALRVPRQRRRPRRQGIPPRAGVVHLHAPQRTVTDDDKPVTPSIVWGPAIGDITEFSRGVKKSEGILFQGGKVVRLAPKDIAKQSTYDGEFHYAGVDDNYFMVAALAPGAIKVTLRAGDDSAAGRTRKTRRAI